MTIPSTTSRYPDGISTEDVETTLGDYIGPNPFKAHQYFTDFDEYISGNWTVTETQAGATQALADADGGVLLLTNSAADDDLVALQKVGESFLLELGKESWFAAKFKVSDSTQSDVVMGLQITDTTPLAVTDGVYFRKDDADQTLQLVVVKDSTETVTDVIEMADDTYVEVGFHYDGIDKITAFSANTGVAKSVTTNLPDDEELTVSFAVQNGEAVAKIMSIDYIFAAKAR